MTLFYKLFGNIIKIDYITTECIYVYVQSYMVSKIIDKDVQCISVYNANKLKIIQMSANNCQINYSLFTVKYCAAMKTNKWLVCAKEQMY